MVLMDDTALRKWCEARKITVKERILHLTESVPAYVVAEIPESAQEQISFAGDLLALAGFDEAGQDMIWITTWGLWSDWNRDLGEEIITRLRTSPGELPASLESASAQIFSFAERKIAVAVILHLMLFSWDGWLLSQSGEYLVQCSHDGLIWITCRDNNAQSRILDRLVEWKPQTRPMLGR